MFAQPAIIQIASAIAGQPVAISCVRNQTFGTVAEGGEHGYVTGYVQPDGVTIRFDRDEAGNHITPVISIAASTCQRLNRLYYVRDTRKVPSFVHDLVSPDGPIADIENGWAVHLLEHEATHVLEESLNEAHVECDAFHNSWQALRLFHLAAWKARQILRGMAIAHQWSDPDYLTVC